MANLVTLSRLLLLLVVVVLLYQPPGPAQLVAFGLLLIIFFSDALDGHIARKRNETSLLGALFDIAGDRIVELALWIVYADLGLVPIWVPLVFVVRGVAVDAIRGSSATAEGVAPFNLSKSVAARFLVRGRFVRGLYAAVKGAAFCSLALVMSLPVTFPGFWDLTRIFWTGLASFSVYTSVLLCILRGAPVIIEFVLAQRAASDEAS